jgi:hypothetical protein
MAGISGKQCSDCFEIRFLCCKNPGPHVEHFQPCASAKYTITLAITPSSTCLFSPTLPFSLTTSLSSLPHSLSLVFFPCLPFFPLMSLADDNDFIVKYDDSLEHDYLVDKPAPSTSQITFSSGFAVSNIKQLTHNDLWHNAKFMRYVALVDTLLARPAVCEFFFPFFPFYILTTHCIATALAPHTNTPASWLTLPHAMSEPLPFPCPMSHPAHYPVQVLWTLADCQSDPDIRVSLPNWSHPPMRLSVHTEDSSMIMDVEWKSICKAATLIACTCLECLNPSGCRIQAGPTRRSSSSVTSPQNGMPCSLSLRACAPSSPSVPVLGAGRPTLSLAWCWVIFPMCPLSPSPWLFYIIQHLICMFPPLPLWLPLCAVLLSDMGPFTHTVSVHPR